MTDQLITIYRVQSLLDGRGPWRPGFSMSWIDMTRDLDAYCQRKSMADEMGGFDFVYALRPREHGGSGCNSIEQLRYWFNALEMSRLEPRGYSAVIIRDARIIAQSKIQTFFGRMTPLRENVELFKLY